MHINPCGRFVDWGRRPYDVSGRVHLGDNAPIVKLRWYVTDLPAIDYETPINSRDLNRDQWSEYALGELPEWQSERVYNGKWTRPASATGSAGCHAEWLATGEPWPNDLPEQEYDVLGIPVCCGAAVVTPEPSDDCNTATLLELDVEYEYTTGALPEAGLWWKWDLPAGTYHLLTTGIPGPFAGQPEAELWWAPTCSFMLGNAVADPCTAVTISAGDVLKLEVQQTSGPHTITFKLSAGACP